MSVCLVYIIFVGSDPMWKLVGTTPSVNLLARQKLFEIIPPSASARQRHFNCIVLLFSVVGVKISPED